MEQFLHYVWKHRLFALKPQQTTDGKTIEIIDPGLQNTHAGPDFFNAKIKIGGVLWVGNVEIHQQASDWFRHRHHQDPAYDSVILHVASQIDAVPTRTNGELIPQMELHYPSYLASNYEQLLKEDRYPACHELIPPIVGFLPAQLAFQPPNRTVRSKNRTNPKAPGDMQPGLGACFLYHPGA